MVKRHERASFGSAYAFLGGVLEDVDSRVHEICSGLSNVAANRLLDVEQNGLDYYSAAVRELFEEAGVLLAGHDLPAGQLDEARAALNSGMLEWDRFAIDN